MAGHSKWSKIKRQKAVNDNKRGKVYTKMLREIQVAARMGGADIDGNYRLRTAVSAAKAASVPNDNIDKAIKRGAGGTDAVDFEEITYEGYGPGGVALVVKSLTDNRNRTASEVRHAFSKGSGNLGSPNSVSHLFQEKGIFSIQSKELTEDMLMESVLDSGAEDISEESDGEFEVVCSASAYGEVHKAIEGLGVEFESEIRPIADLALTPEKADLEALARLVELLDDLDDVQDVYTNAEGIEEYLS